jgi:hypothetical protein
VHNGYPVRNARHADGTAWVVSDQVGVLGPQKFGHGECGLFVVLPSPLKRLPAAALNHGDPRYTELSRSSS